MKAKFMPIPANKRKNFNLNYMNNIQSPSPQGQNKESLEFRIKPQTKSKIFRFARSVPALIPSFDTDFFAVVLIRSRFFPVFEGFAPEKGGIS